MFFCNVFCFFLQKQYCSKIFNRQMTTWSQLLIWLKKSVLLTQSKFFKNFRNPIQSWYLRHVNRLLRLFLKYQQLIIGLQQKLTQSRNFTICIKKLFCVCFVSLSQSNRQIWRELCFLRWIKYKYKRCGSSL